MNSQILVVDDEASIRSMIRMALEQEDFGVHEAHNVHQASKIMQAHTIDLILLDWMMPGVSGIEYARRLKRENHDGLGIIMLTARSEESDTIRGLDAGADDYVSKPFSPRELIARIQAVLRRRQATTPKGEILEQGAIRLDTQEHRVNIKAQQVALSPTEFKLLAFFLRHPERVYDRNQLLDQVWGDHVYVEDRTVDVHIRRLRKVLEPHNCDTYIDTVRGVGYRFSPKH